MSRPSSPRWSPAPATTSRADASSASYSAPSIARDGLGDRNTLLAPGVAAGHRRLLIDFGNSFGLRPPSWALGIENHLPDRIDPEDARRLAAVDLAVIERRARRYVCARFARELVDRWRRAISALVTGE